jgi:hypothetical protein
VSVLLCQLGKAQSLWEICGGLASSKGKLNHLGWDEGPRRTTLAYANEHRSWKIYEEMFYHLLGQARQYDWRKRKFRFKNNLFSMDATCIELCLSMFDWAHFRRANGAIKLHLVLDHDGCLPTFAHISDDKSHELKLAKNVIVEESAFPRGSIVVFNRGYIDLSLFARWCEEGVIFVTRMKDNASYDIVQHHKQPKHSSILRDEIIEFNGRYSAEKCPHELRRIEMWNEENQNTIVLLTNHLTFGRTTIAAIYKDRWQIEISFKTINQNLRIKTFMGTSLNAVHVQFSTALIAILLLKILKLRSTFAWSMSNMVAMLRFNLFTYRDLWQWIDAPFESVHTDAGGIRLSLFSAGLGQHAGG